MRTVLFILISTVSVFSSAQAAFQCPLQTSLAKGLSTRSLFQCWSHLNACPISHNTPPPKSTNNWNQLATKNPMCLAKALNTDPVCNQLKSLNKAMNTTLLQLGPFSQLGLTTVMTQLHSADGQMSYWLVTSTGCLINTSQTAEKWTQEYSKQWGKPLSAFSSTPPQLTSVDSLNIHMDFTLKNCLACKTIQTLTITWVLNTSGLVTGTLYSVH